MHVERLSYEDISRSLRCLHMPRHPYQKFLVHFGADGLLIISGNQTSKCLLTVISEPIRPIPIPSTRPTGSRLAKIA